MQSRRLFEGKGLWGKIGLYPFTAENLMRIGLALCTYLKAYKEIRKPRMSIDSLNFLTLSIAVGFMAGGGDVYIDEEGDVVLKHALEEDHARLWFEKMEEYELKMLESILFSRYNMPRAEGEEVGSLWIQKKTL